MRIVSRQAEAELEDCLGHHWTDHCVQQQGTFAAQTILVLWFAINDEDYLALDAGTRDAVKWACLLHGLGKVGAPIIDGEDFIYPLASAQIALDVMAKRGLGATTDPAPPLRPARGDTEGADAAETPEADPTRPTGQVTAATATGAANSFREVKHLLHQSKQPLPPRVLSA